MALFLRSAKDHTFAYSFLSVKLRKNLNHIKAQIQHCAKMRLYEVAIVSWSIALARSHDVS